MKRSAVDSAPPLHVLRLCSACALPVLRNCSACAPQLLCHRSAIAPPAPCRRRFQRHVHAPNRLQVRLVEKRHFSGVELHMDRRCHTAFP